MKVQILHRDGEEVFAVVPIELWRELLEKAEALDEIRAFDEAVAALERGEEELVPEEVAARLAAGEPPLRVWREYRGLSQHELAARAGLSQAYLAQLEAGRRKGSLEAFRRLAEALRVDLDDLVP